MSPLTDPTSPEDQARDATMRKLLVPDPPRRSHPALDRPATEAEKARVRSALAVIEHLGRPAAWMEVPSVQPTKADCLAFLETFAPKAKP